jgi:hypothetical protein
VFQAALSEKIMAKTPKWMKADLIVELAKTHPGWKSMPSRRKQV